MSENPFDEEGTPTVPDPDSADPKELEPEDSAVAWPDADGNGPTDREPEFSSTDSSSESDADPSSVTAFPAEQVSQADFGPDAADAPPAPALEAPIAPPSSPAPPGGSVVLLLFLWAMLATAGFFYLYWFCDPNVGGLENLPDDGLYAPDRIIAPTSDLLPRQRIPLGESRLVGGLVVTPVTVRRATAELETGGGQPLPLETLELSLRLRNVTDQAFHPLDPVFLYFRDVPTGKRLTEPGQPERFYTYSYAHPDGHPGESVLPPDVRYQLEERIVGQEFPELEPGAQAVAVVYAALEPDEELTQGTWQWRVQLRKGITPNGKGVATVIGAVFDAQDVTDTGESEESGD